MNGLAGIRSINAHANIVAEQKRAQALNRAGSKAENTPWETPVKPVFLKGPRKVTVQGREVVV